MSSGIISGSKAGPFVVIVIVCMLLAFSIGVVLTSTSQKLISSDTNTIIQDGNMIVNADYVVWTDGTNYYAQNCSTGANELEGKDASKIIHEISVNGSEIYFKSGLYKVIDTIDLTNRENINYVGAGMGVTILMAANGLNGDIFYIKDSQMIQFSYMTLNGNGPNQSIAGNLINCERSFSGFTDKIILRSMQLLNASYCNVRIYDSNDGGTGYIGQLEIYDSFIDFAKLAGIMVSADDCIIESNDVGQNGYGMLLYSSGNSVISNNFWGSYHDGVLATYSTAHITAKDNRIEGNRFDYNHDNGLNCFGIYTTNIVGNDFRLNSQAHPGTYSGLYVSGNETYKTNGINVVGNSFGSQLHETQLYSIKIDGSYNVTNVDLDGNNLIDSTDGEKARIYFNGDPATCKIDENTQAMSNYSQEIVRLQLTIKIESNFLLEALCSIS